MKIICIGRNYANHIAELQNERPEEPVIFLKPDSAVLPDKTPFVIPDFSSDIHHEIEVIVKINKLGKYIDKKVTFGFRPEYIYDKATEFTRHLSEDVKITIDVVEPIGSESYNYFHFNDNPEHSFCFRTTTNILYKPEQELMVGVDIERLRFFDGITEERIA